MTQTYDERREARQDRIDGRADRINAEISRRVNAAHAAVEGIPFGQPILVGHHSEGKHRAALKRHDVNMRAACDANDLLRTLPTAPTTAILASDADACDQLRAKIAKLEDLHARMKAANVMVRKNDRAGLTAAGWSDKHIESLFTPQWGAGRGPIGFPAYELTSNTANLARMRQRLAQLETAKAAPSTEREEAGVRIEEDTEAMRLRLHFDGKPAPVIIAELKSCGFRWAPSEGAWQRQLNNAARYALIHVLRAVTAAA